MSKLSKKIVTLLKKKRLKLAVAESCTGGLVSQLFTDNSGSSKVFKGSFIAYSNEVKRRQIKC